MNLRSFFIGNIFTELIARIIGLFFLIPFCFFISQKINKKYMHTCYKIFFLIVVQGIIGWYMVKSGLVNDVTVSHYRLSIHLGIAIFIISTIFWLVLNIFQKIISLFFTFPKKIFHF